MHHSRISTFVLDCQAADLAVATTFWAAALGRAPEGAPASDRYVGLPGHPDDVLVVLQRVEHPSRIHLDIETDDVPAEVARLRALGATHVAAVQQWHVLEAPSGHRFCVVPTQSPHLVTRGARWAAGAR